MESPRTPGKVSGLLRRARRLTADFTGTSRARRASKATGSFAYDVIPPELWLKVFSHIPPYLLPSVTITCRSFQSLAQPLLFTTVVTHPEQGSSRGAQTSKYRKRVANRLEFFFSRHIAPTVRECKISLASPEEDDDLIDFIFDALPHLPALTTLECRHVRLTPERLATLQNLCLTTITLELCFGEISDFTVAPSVPLQEVTFRYHDSSLTASPCSIFLSPTRLESLHATTISVLSSIARSETFTKLRTLDLPIECLATTDFLPALLRCPAVEHLSLHSGARSHPHSLEALPPGVLPLLNSYCGPHHLAPAFLGGRTPGPHHVDIPRPARPHTLGASLAKLPRTVRTLSFALSTPDIPPTLLPTLHSLFPTLASLSILQPALSSRALKAFLLGLETESRYTSALTDLTLRAQGRDKYGLWVPPAESAADARACFAKVQSALVKTYPAIERVRFHHGAEQASVAWTRDLGSGGWIQVESW
ncbi:hypothetical protein B0H14DRAFT_1412787 [Mycena olivaceomarginata]|nr:hypothetical protein B0H14DRAFT_1412787 [Mycena olivaceomarginata]